MLQFDHKQRNLLNACGIDRQKAEKELLPVISNKLSLYTEKSGVKFTPEEKVFLLILAIEEKENTCMSHLLQSIVYANLDDREKVIDIIKKPSKLIEFILQCDDVIFDMIVFMFIVSLNKPITDNQNEKDI